MTSPIKARVRPKEFSTAGIGASNVISSQNGPSRDAPNVGPATTGSQPTAPEHAHETASSPLFTESSTIQTRKSSGHYPNEANHLKSPPEKIPCESSSVPPGVNHVGSADDSASTHGGGIREVNTTVKTSNGHPDSHPSTPPQDVGNTHPLASQVPPTSTNVPLRFFFPEMLPVQSVPLHLPPPPVNSQDCAPVNIPLGSASLPPRPILPNLPSRPPSPQNFGIPYVTRSRGKSVVIGMPMDDAKVGGTRGSFAKKLEPPPNPSCSLVMETLPRKFRTDSFVLDWLSQFTFKPRQYELAEGKAFFEFKNPRDAQLAWKSPRMGGMEGLFGVRLFWYRVLPQLAYMDMDTIRKVNATGTIENPARSPPPPVPYSSTDDLRHRPGFKVDLPHSQIPTQKTASLPPPPPHSIVIEEDPGVTVNVNPPTEASRSNLNNQTSQGGGPTVPSPSMTTRPLAACSAPSDPPDNHMNADCVMRDLPPSGVPRLILGASTSPTVSTSSSPALSSSSAPSSSRTSSSAFPSFSPEVLNSAVSITFVDRQVPPALNQGPIQASNLAAEPSHMETEVRESEFEKADGTPLGAEDYMDTTDAAALAKEQALRKMVLQSRKRKLLEPSSIRQPTSAASATTTSGSTLHDLAVNFIADAIARPPPAKIVKITPPAAAMAAWGKRLEQHVESSKAIMAKIQLTQSKVERDRLMIVLREKDRCVVLITHAEFRML